MKTIDDTKDWCYECRRNKNYLKCASAKECYEQDGYDLEEVKKEDGVKDEV